VKSLKTISLEKFKELFPDMPIRGEDLVISDPQKVLDIIFGGGVTPKDVETAEQVTALIDKKLSPARIKKTEQIAKATLGRLGREIRIPKRFR
jgi:hypothetical protein